VPSILLKVGDVVSLRPRPKGVFILDPRLPSHLMVATVTGIAPFVSIVRHFLVRGDGRFRYVVLHGASYQNELVYGAELAEAAARYPEALVYVPTVSRPADARNRGWEGRLGRVNVLVEHELAVHALAPDTTLAYACGHPGMVADVAARLGTRGFAVKEERYWRE
jgi:ferredoxin-NADP reductase